MNIKTVCPVCGKSYDVEVINSVNVSVNPEMKDKVTSGELFVRQCPFCGGKHLVKFPFIYSDPDRKVVLCLTDLPITVESVEGYSMRKVAEVGELLEKINIFSCELDDIVMEMCKYVTCQELKKEVKLKFLRLDGADNDLIMAYPENGKMEMIQLGFNVYEDCRGIVSRNPSITEAAQGLIQVDQQWIGKFFR